jgi:hypothetical protein
MFHRCRSILTQGRPVNILAGFCSIVILAAPICLVCIVFFSGDRRLKLTFEVLNANHTTFTLARIPPHVTKAHVLNLLQ